MANEAYKYDPVAPLNPVVPADWDGFASKGDYEAGPENKMGFFDVAPVTQPAAIAAPTAPGAIYSQAEAASMKTAVDAIRAALTALGLTA